jgi:hypothetical protein
MASLRILSPHDGGVLNRHDGAESADDLLVTVSGTAPGGAPVSVNGVPATVEGARFSARVSLRARRTRLVAEAGGECDAVEVWWSKGSQRRFRFSVDDNIQFLKDLGTEPESFGSLFDHWYLAFWRQMHREYGAKVHINIYYQTDGFDLTQMPDKWKDEWQANAQWLHLSFHALQDKPDRPYRNATYTQMAHDYDLVCGHIRRFAGNEVLGNTTTVHWGECPLGARLALRDRGIERLVGLFGSDQGMCTTGYQLPLELSDTINTRDAWHERESGITMVTCDLVVNCFEVEQIVPLLERQAESPHTGEMMELLIHEQYFRQDLAYPYYQPTVMDKVRTALGWATENGYGPCFWSEGYLGTAG